MSSGQGLTSLPGMYKGATQAPVYIPEGGVVNVNDVVANSVTTTDVILDGQTLTAQDDVLLLNGVPVGGSGQVGTLSQVLNAGNSAGSFTINMNNNRITGLAPPNATTDAVQRAYVDDNFLPFSGGTLTGNLTVPSITGDTNTDVLTINSSVNIPGNNISAGNGTFGNLYAADITAVGSGQPIGINSSIQLLNNNLVTTGSINVGNLYTNNIIANTNGQSINVGSGASLINITAPVSLNANNLVTTGEVQSANVNAGVIQTSNLNGNSGIALQIGSGAAGISMEQDVSLNGNDITDVNDITMSGLAATISNTAGTLSMSAVGVSVNSLGSVSINAANALSFSSSIEKFKMKDNTMSSTNSTDLTINDVDVIGNSNNNNIDFNGGTSNNDLVLNSPAGIALNPASSSVPLQMFNLPNTTSASTGFGLAYNPTSGQVSYSASALAPTTLPFCSSATLNISSSTYTISATDANKAYFVVSDNNTPTCNFVFPTSTTDSALQNAYITFYFGGNTVVTFTNAIAVGPLVTIFNPGDSCIVQFFSSLNGSPPSSSAVPQLISIVRGTGNGGSVFGGTSPLNLSSGTYTISAADIGKAYFVTQTNAGVSNTFINFVDQTNYLFDSQYITIFNNGNSATSAAGTGGIRIDINSVQGSDAQLAKGEAAIIQYFSNTTQGLSYTARVIATYQFSNPTLSAVLEAGNTTGAYDIVMGDGGATKANLINTGTADIVNLQVGALQPLEPLLGNVNIGVEGNLVFDPDVPQTGSISNITTLAGVATNAIGVSSDIDMNGNDIQNVSKITGDKVEVNATDNIALISAGSVDINSGGQTMMKVNGDEYILMNNDIIQFSKPLDMGANAIQNCPTITAIEGDITTIEGDITALQTDKLDKSSALYVNSYYVNDNVNDPQTVVDAIGADQGNVIYMGAGSYGGIDLLISQANNLAIIGPAPGGPSTICELASGRGLTISSPAQRVRVANIQVEGLTLLGAAGNNYFQSVQMLGGLQISNGAIGSYFFYDCEIAGAITVPSDFAGGIGFIRCNFAGATFSLNNASPLQVQFAQALNLVATYPLKAIYGGTNQLANGTVFEGVNVIQPVGATTFSTVGCSTLGRTLTYDSGSGALSLVAQSGATLSTVTVTGGGGGGGGSGFYLYNVDTGDTTAPPATGKVIWNAPQASATSVTFSHLTSDGDDIDVFLEAIQFGDVLILQDQNNSANYQKYTVNGAPTYVSNSYYTFPIDINASTVTFGNNDAVALIPLLVRGVQSVSAGSGVTVTGTATNPIVNADVIDIQAGNGITVTPVSGVYTISTSTPTLSQVLEAGPSAGASAINMNGNSIDEINTVNTANLKHPDGSTPVSATTGFDMGGTNIGNANSVSATFLTAVNIVQSEAVDATTVSVDNIENKTGSPGTAPINVGTDINFNGGYGIQGANLVDTQNIEVGTISGPDPGQPGSQWNSSECANLGAGLSWNSGTRSLKLTSQTLADVGSPVTISAGSLSQVLLTGATASASIQMNNNSIVGIDTVETQIVRGIIGGDWASEQCASLASDLQWTEGSRELQLVSQTGALLGSPVVISGGGGGGVGTLEQVLTAGPDAGGLGMINVGDIYADSFQGQGTNANIVLGPGTGSLSNVVSALLPISMDGARPNIENVATIRGKPNATFNVEAQLANPLVFKTFGAEAMRITSGQNVGIGATAPSEKLEVVGGNVKIGAGYNFLGNVIGNLDGTANVATNLSGKSAHKLPYYNGSATLSYADTTVAGSICSTDGNDVQFINPNTLDVNSAVTASSAATADRASNVASSGAGVVYNTGVNTTTLTPGLGLNGQVLTTNGTAITFTNQSDIAVGTATNIVGGSAGNLLYQTGSGQTAKLSNGTQGQVLVQGATNPTWTTIPPTQLVYSPTVSLPAITPTQVNSIVLVTTTSPLAIPIGSGFISFRLNMASGTSPSVPQFSFLPVIADNTGFTGPSLQSLNQGHVTIAPVVNGGTIVIPYVVRTSYAVAYIRVSLFTLSTSFSAGNTVQASDVRVMVTSGTAA